MSKLTGLKNLLKEGQAILIYTPVSRLYISGFESSLGYLFITKEKSLLFVDGRYIEAAKKGVNEDIEVRLFTNIYEDVKSFLGKEIKTLLVETSNTVASVRSFEKIFAREIIPSDTLEDTLYSLRLIKNDYEVDCIIKAQRIAQKAFDEILKFIRPGVRETEIAAELEYRMKLGGSAEPSFGTIAVSGEKTSMPHGVPGDRKVKSGDFITMDFGAVYRGYHSDMTRTVAVGNVTDEMKNVYDTVLNANLAALEKVRAGVKAADVDLAAREVIKKAGYGEYFTHSTGHGVGLEIHENPNISFKNEKILENGNIITIEPGIYLPGKFGVRTEDMVLVTKNGCNNLTNAPKRLIII